MKALTIILVMFLIIASFAIGWTALAEAASTLPPAIEPLNSPPPTRELSAFEKSLQMTENVSTKETIVQNGSRKFRRIEINSEIFYLQLQTEMGTQSDLALLCGENALQFGRNSPALITGAVRLTKRTRFFIEGIRTMCLGTANNPRLQIAPEIAIGFMLDDDPSGKALLTNRRISINPFAVGPNLNFNADF